MNKNMKKKALVSSILTIALCFSVIAGATFALFTSESKVNIAVTSGKVNLEAYIDETSLATSSLGVAQTAGTFAVGGTASFDKDADLTLDKIVPGDKATFEINVKNNSNVDIMYKITWTVDNTALDVLEVTSNGAALAALGWTEWKAADAGTNKVIPVEIELPMDVSDEKYQGQTANVTFAVEAVQANAVTETVATEEQLLAALETGATELALTDSITLSNTLVLDEDTELTLVLNGNTITNANGVALQNDGNLTLVDSATMTLSAEAEAKVGGIKGTSMDASVRNAIVNNGTMTITGGIYESAATYAINNAGTMIVNGITTNGGIYNGGDLVINNSTLVNKSSGRHTVYHGGTSLTINGGSYDNHSGNEVVRANAANVVINDGTFTMTGKSYLMGSSANGNIIVNGGTFNGYVNENGTNDAMRPGCAVVNGGTFNFNPSAWVKEDGYFETIDNEDGTFKVVPKEGVAAVTTPEALTEELTNAGAAGSGDSTIVLLDDVDLTGTTWTPIKVDGYHGADIVTIEGNYNTITGLTAPLFAGGFAGGSGIVIRNLTIADSNIVSTNTLGSGAFIESVDSMDTITLENCHLINSTVSGSRTGGLLGWTAGYNNVNDGPVKTYVTIEDCSVKNCTITGSSVGAINGHAGNNAWTYTTIDNCVIENNKLISTDDGEWRVGVVVGTANVGEVTISNITESGNTLTQTGKTAPEGQSNLYGRFVPGDTGTLEIDGYQITKNVANVDKTLSEGGNVTLTDDLKVNSKETEASTGYGAAGVSVKGGVLDGNGNTLTVSNAWNTWDCAIDISNGTIKNLTINSGMRGIFVNGNTDKVIIDNVTVDGSVYTISCDEGENGGLEATNSTFNGWTSYAATIGNVKFDNCNFGEGSGYAYCRPYAPTEFVGCDFEEGFLLEPCAAVTFENCTIGGVALTAENLATLVIGNIGNASVK